MNTIANPYVGPQPFQESERNRFFGRKREARDLLSLVVAEQLVLFYAQSGAGKSSLINTCLIPDLRARGFEVFTGRVVGDIPPGIQIENTYVFNLLRSLASGQSGLDSLGKLTISELLAKLRNDAAFEFTSVEEDSRRHAVIVDQFEEIFSTHHEAWEQREGFFQQLSQAMEDDPYLWVVLVMREDFIASLDPYAYLVPGRFRRRYYMQRLEREAALEAIKKPVENLRPYAQGVAEKLVRDLCSVKIYRPDGKPDVQPGQYVEPVQLQVICHNLWKNLPPGGTHITEKDIQDVGDVNASLGNYYADRVKAVAEARNVSERKIREWFTSKLISPGGIRTMVLQEHGEKSSGLENEIIQALSDLIRAEQRGGATFYELTHDRLVEPIIENNKKWDSEHASPFRSHAEAWKKSGSDVQLLSDQNLADAVHWAQDNQEQLSTTEKDFLEASQLHQTKIEKARAQEREIEQEKLRAAEELARVRARAARRAWLYTLFSLGLAIIAIFTGTYALIQSNTANEQRIIAQKAAEDARAEEERANKLKNSARANELSTIALDRADSEIDLAILLGLQAHLIDPSPRTQNTLLAIQQKSGRLLQTLDERHDIQDLQYSPDGEYFASRGKDGITFWDTDTFSVLNSTPINGHVSPISVIAFHQNKGILASGANNGTIAFWDVTTHQMIDQIASGHTGSILSLAFNRDGRILASGSYDNTIILWDVETRQSIGQPLIQEGGSVNSVAFSPNGRILASTTYSNTITLWDVFKPDTPTQLGQLPGQGDYVTSLAFSPDGGILASGSYDGTILLWDVEERQTIGQSPSALPGAVWSLAFHPLNDEILAASAADGTVILWDLSNTSEPPSVLIEPSSDTPTPPGSFPDLVSSIAFSPDGKVLTTSGSAKISFWDVATRQPVGTPIDRQNGTVRTIIFADNKTLIAGDGNLISFWDITNSSKPQKSSSHLPGHTGGQVTGMQFSSDGSFLRSYGEDGTILIDVQKRTPIGLGDIWAVSQSGNLIAYQLYDRSKGVNTIYLWDAASGETIGTPIPGERPNFSPDGSLLQYQTLDSKTKQNRIHIWDIKEEKELPGAIFGEFKAFSPNNEIFVYQSYDSASNQTFINLWDIEDGEHLGQNIAGTHVAISPDSKTLIYQSFGANLGNPVIKRWDIASARTFDQGIPGNFLMASQKGNVLVIRRIDTATRTSSIDLIDSATGRSLLTSLLQDGTPLTISEDGRIFFYQPYINPGINAVDTQTGIIIGNPLPGNFSKVLQNGQVLAFETYAYNNGKNEYTVTLFDISNLSQIGAPIPGFSRNLTQNGNLLLYETFENSRTSIHFLDTKNNLQIGEPLTGTFLAISPDGKTVLTRGERNIVAVWDITKTWPFGEPLLKFEQRISVAALSSNSDVLGWITEEGIRLHDITTNTPIGEPFMNHFRVADISSISMSPDGKLITTPNPKENTTTLWDIPTGQRLSDPIPGSSFTLFSPDSKTLITIDGIFESATTTIWDITDPRHPEAVGDRIPGFLASFSPDGKSLVIGGDNEKMTLKLWDVTTRQIIDDSIPGVYGAFSPDGKTLAVLDPDNEIIQIWDLTTFKTIGDSIPGVFMCFSPDGAILAVGNLDNTTALWDLRTGEVIDESIPGSYPIRFSKDGKILVISGDDLATIVLWDLSAGKQIGNSVIGVSNTGPNFPIPPYAGSSPDDELFAFYDSDRNAMLWNVETNTTVDTPEYPGEISGVNLNQNGPFFAQNYFTSPPDVNLLAIYGNRGLMIWDLNTKKILGQPIPLDSLIPIPGTNLIISPHGKRIASYAEDGIVIRDVETQKDTPLDNSAQLNGNMIFSTDSLRLNALGEGNILMRWDVSTGKQTIPDVQPHEGVSILAPVFSPDGRYLAYEINSDNKTQLYIWDIESEQSYLGQPIQLENLGGVITFSPDGNWMAYSDGAKLNLYNIRTKEHQGEMQSGLNGISSVSMITEDNALRYVITIDFSGSTQIWDWATRTKIGDPISGRLQVIGNNNRDRSVIYIDSSGTLIRWRWDVDKEKWRQLLCPLAKRNLTLEEWKVYFPDDKDYVITCPD